MSSVKLSILVDSAVLNRGHMKPGGVQLTLLGFTQNDGRNIMCGKEMIQLKNSLQQSSMLLVFHHLTLLN